MPVFDTRYFMQQDHIQPFIMKRKHEDEHEDEDSTLTLIVDIEDWWLDLPCDMQKKTPLLGCSSSPYVLGPPLTILSVHIPEGKIYHDGVVWFRTRHTAVPNMDSVNKIEANKIIKRHFLEAIGLKFDESQLVFLVQPWNRRL